MQDIHLASASERLSSSLPLLVGISSNALSIIQLAKENFGNEVYPISRCLIERIITFYYIQYCSDSEFQNYMDYSHQKTFRKLSGLIKINEKEFSIEYQRKIDLNDFPELKNAVEKFTSKKK